MESTDEFHEQGRDAAERHKNIDTCYHVLIGETNVCDMGEMDVYTTLYIMF
jgi:hypothetical protein